MYTFLTLTTSCSFSFTFLPSIPSLSQLRSFFSLTIK